MSTAKVIKYDPDRAAIAIKLKLVADGIPQGDYCKRISIARQTFNMFLNRHVDLRQDQIEFILQDLGISYLFE